MLRLHVLNGFEVSGEEEGELGLGEIFLSHGGELFESDLISLINSNVDLGDESVDIGNVL